MTLPKRHQRGFWTPNENATKITGRFQVTGVPGVLAIAGAGWTVAYTGVGRYTVTITGTHWTQIISCKATVENTLHNVDLYAQIESITCAVGTAPTVCIRAKNNAVTTEVTAGDFVHFEITLLSAGVDA